MKIIRTIIERLSRGKVFKRKIRVGGKTIPLLVSPDSQLKYLKFGAGVFDQDLINIAEQYLDSDSNVWDVGANVGVFTFAASSVAHDGTVVSIEADIWLANILRKTAMFNEYSNNNICVLPVAISNENSIASFVIAARGRASNALKVAGGRSQMGGIRETQYVPTLTLDTLLNTFSAPDFVKIDVEGAEYMVVQGATHLINKVRPIFYIEVGDDVSSQILKIFQSANYGVFDPEGKRLMDSCAPNTFFIPEEKNKP
ncbi:MAG: FkbM family methyltransferase [Gammaproteobacteria bacterium]|nr:FkbM family methyltransferase [Gammaproteobacteria bacterium]